MTDKQRYEKYKNEHCKNCKNRNTDLCEIRISQINDITNTKCEYYKNESPKPWKKKPIGSWQKW